MDKGDQQPEEEKNTSDKTNNRRKVSSQPCFISLIDESDKPLLIYVPNQNDKDVNEILKYNVFSNTSLDYFDSPLFDWISLESQPTVKLFFQLEGVAVFGMLVKPTGLKIVIGFPQESYDSEVHEKAIYEFFQKIKQIYLKVKLNPFLNIANGNITNKEALIKKLEARMDVEL